MKHYLSFNNDREGNCASEDLEKETLPLGSQVMCTCKFLDLQRTFIVHHKLYQRYLSYSVFCKF